MAIVVDALGLQGVVVMVVVVRGGLQTSCVGTPCAAHFLPAY